MLWDRGLCQIIRALLSPPLLLLHWCLPAVPADPEIRVHKIDREYDEFLIMATDGLWDYYTPESTVLTDARRKLRQCNNDAQQTADWLVGGAGAEWGSRRLGNNSANIAGGYTQCLFAVRLARGRLPPLAELC